MGSTRNIHPDSNWRPSLPKDHIGSHFLSLLEGKLQEIKEQSPKKTVKVEKIRELILQLKEFNSLNLQEIELTENGQVISISDAVHEEWKLIGLTNQSFVEMEFWKKPLDSSEGN